MAKFSSIYKQTAPTRRTVNGENSYEKGMMWSNQALMPGYTRTLLNFEVDTLTGALTIPGGFHTTDVAAGCTFLDSTYPVLGKYAGDKGYKDTIKENACIVVQRRNEYFGRAFEGITNLIGIQKFSLNSNNTLIPAIDTQKGYNNENTECYKFLTYNPLNNRLMCGTLLKTIKDDYFKNTGSEHDLLVGDYTPRKITINPISCGQSSLKYRYDDNGDVTGTYITNRLEHHPNGAVDNYLPSISNLPLLYETFGQRLYRLEYMQSVPYCEGYGNKTFLFAKEKITKLEGTLVDPEEAIYEENYEIESFELRNQLLIDKAGGFFENEEEAILAWGSKGGVAGQVLEIYPSPETDCYIPLKVLIKEVADATWFYTSDTERTNPQLLEGVILNWEIKQLGRFKWNGSPHKLWTTSTPIKLNVGDYNIKQFLLKTPETLSNTQHDIYFGDINTGLHTFKRYEIDNNSIPVDYAHFGKALTSVGFNYSGANYSYSDTVADSSSLSQEIGFACNKDAYPSGGALQSVIGIDLNTGKIKSAFNDLPENSSLHIAKLPILASAGETNDTVLSDIFKTTVIPNWELKQDWFHPADLLTDNIQAKKRIGQSFRIAGTFKIINTLTERPYESLKTYSLPDESPSSQFLVLDYTWTGTGWSFGFIDSFQANTLFSTNFDINALDAMGNHIIRHNLFINKLTYLDIITPNNVTDLTEHISDTFQQTSDIVDAKRIGDYSPIGDSASIQKDLKLRVNAKIATPSRFVTNPPYTPLENFTKVSQTKLYDTSFGHFKVTPKELSPSEAGLWGYNMLSPTPYNFVCQNTPGLSPTLTGVLLMRNGQPLLTPLVNTPGVLYIYYNSDRASVENADTQGYQLTIEYKNPYDEWRTLKEFSIEDTHEALSSGQPIQVPFTSPDEMVLIRATLLDRNESVDVALMDGTTEIHFLTVSSLIYTISYTKDPNQNNISPEVYDLGTATGLTYWKSRLVCWGVENARNILFTSEPNEPEYFAYPNGIDLFDEDIMHIIPYSDALIIFTSTKLWRIDMLGDGLSWTKTLLQQNLRFVEKDIPYIVLLKNMLFFKSGEQFFMLVPQRTGTVGEVTIAPISKAILEFLKNPFKNLKDILRVTYPELVTNTRPINDYLVKYGAHIEQNKIFVDWWFDLTAFKNQEVFKSYDEIYHDVLKTNEDDDSPQLLPKEYWLVQLVYDVQTYSWSMRTHTTSNIGLFINDAANVNTEFVSLVFSPEPYTPNSYIFQTPYSVGFPGFRYAKATWGVSINQRKTTNDSLLQQFALTKSITSGIQFSQTSTLVPTYPRFQIFDTGYKEVSTPALKKHFREIQFTFEPREAVQVEPDGDAVGIRAVLLAQIDGQTVMSAVSQEITEELQEDGTLIIKVVDQINYQDIQLTTPSIVPLPYLMDSELSNTFVLESSALSGVKNVKVRRAINGKGQLIRMRFTNITESNYAIISHAFVSHNKNAR